MGTIHFLCINKPLCVYRWVFKSICVSAKVNICVAVPTNTYVHRSTCQGDEMTKTQTQSLWKAVSKSLLLFWKICQTPRIAARVCMINKKQLFHEMLGGEGVLSL